MDLRRLALDQPLGHSGYLQQLVLFEGAAHGLEADGQPGNRRNPARRAAPATCEVCRPINLALRSRCRVHGRHRWRPWGGSPIGTGRVLAWSQPCWGPGMGVPRNRRPGPFRPFKRPSSTGWPMPCAATWIWPDSGKSSRPSNLSPKSSKKASRSLKFFCLRPMMQTGGGSRECCISLWD